MDLVLRVLEGSNAGQSIKIAGPKFFIGRADDCQLRPKSDLISRHHCCLMVEDGYIAVRDFGSKNGTLINGERVIGEQELNNGDKLLVGPLAFEVQLVQPVAAPIFGAKLPAVKDVQEVAQRTAEKAASSAGGMDVSQWLTGHDASSSETRPIDLSSMASAHDTIVGSVSAADTTVSGESQVDAAGKKDSKKVYGKLPAIPKSTTKDSREAATETLRKLFKGR